MWLFISIINLLLSFQADKQFGRNKLKTILYCSLLIISNLIVFGLRDIGVGTDTLFYIDDYFYYASSMSRFHDYIYAENSLHISYDKGYLLLAWISSFFANDSRALMFFTELFIILFIVLGLLQYKKIFKYNMCLFMWFFILLYQNETINLLRQFCAMSILFYGFSFFLQRKYSNYMICQIIAYYFHSTSLIFVLLPIAFLISQKERRIRNFYLYGMIIVCLTFSLAYQFALNLIEYSGLLKESYTESYAADSKFSRANHIRLQTIVCFVIPFIMYIYTKNKYKNESFLYMNLFLILINFLLQLSSYFVIEYFQRIAIYFGLIMLVYLSAMIYLRSKYIVTLNYILSCILVIYIARAFYLNHYTLIDGVYNRHHLVYKSQILNIE